jgi:hypothetical protein
MLNAMKKIAIAAILAFAIVSCEDITENPGCLEVSLVSELCGHAVLKIESPLYYHLGETWNGHNNVFYTFFDCEDMGKEKEGTFFVEILEEFKEADCPVCLAMIDYQGEKKYPVKIVDVCVQDIEE